MKFALIVFCLIACISPAIVHGQNSDNHKSANPVYAGLQDDGIAIGETKVKLAAPTMQDGLPAAQQRAIISEVGGNAYDFNALTRKSTVAPHVMATPELVEEGARYRKVDFYFVTYGKLSALTDEAVLQRMLDPNKEEGDGDGITPEKLAAYDIKIDPDQADHDGYGHVNFVLEKKVDLSLTGRAFWSQTDESIVATMLVDPRFDGDGELANAWRPMSRNESGQLTSGEAQPYTGMGMYMKVTKLKDVDDGLFVECHIVFSEPEAWFDGRNYLASKLPPVISKQVRTMRGELSKASK